MRNLKRALSLALAFVMVMSLMIVGTSAKSYTDADKIDNQVAVEILGEIGVMIGNDDGSFAPDRDVTRAEMAVIITRILYGNNMNVDQFKDMNTFTDVPDWAEGFVNLCASLDIIAGRGNGIFDPDATVTTAEAALMLSRALGYFKNNAEFGNDWALAAMKRATQAGIIGGDMVLQANEGLTRDDVAQMTFNTLTKAVPVQYNELLNVYYNENKGIIYALTFYYTDTLGYKNFNLVYKTGEETTYGRPATTWGIGSYNGNSGTSTSGNDNYGLNEDGSLKPGNVKMLASDEIVTVAETPDYVYTAATEQKDLYKDLGRGIITDYTWTVYVDGHQDDADADKHEVARPANSSNDYIYTDSGMVTEIYVDSVNETVTVVCYYNYIGQVSRVHDDEDGTYVQLTGITYDGGNYSDINDALADVDASLDTKFYTSNFAEDDYVVFTVDCEDRTGSDYDAHIVTMNAPETADGVVKAVSQDPKYDTGNYIELDDTKYVYSEVSAKDLDNNDLDADPALETEYRLFLDPNGYVIGFSALEDISKNYVYVVDASESTGDVEAKVLFPDGTVAKIDVNGTIENFNGKGYAASDYEVENDANADTLEGKVFAYEKDSKDVYTFTFETAAQYEVNIETDKASIYTTDVDNQDTTVFTVDLNTVYADLEDEVAYTGYTEVPNYDGATIMVVDHNGNGMEDIVFIVDQGVKYGEDSTYFYVASATDYKTVKIDNTQYTYRTVYVDGEKIDKNSSEPFVIKASKDNIAATGIGLYKVVKVDDQGRVLEYVKVDVENNLYLPISEVGKNSVVTNQTTDDNKSGKWTWNTDTIWVHVYSDGTKVETGSKSDIIYDDTLVAGDEITYVYVAKNDKQLAQLIYVIDGEYTATVYKDDDAVKADVATVTDLGDKTATELANLLARMNADLAKDIGPDVKTAVNDAIDAIEAAQANLTAAQTAAKAALDQYKEEQLDLYEDKLSAAEAREIQNAVDAGKAAIDAAAKSGVDAALAAAKSAIDEVTEDAAALTADEKKVADAKAQITDVTLDPVASTSEPDAEAIKAKLPSVADVTYSVTEPSWNSITAGKEDTFTATVTVTITSGDASDTKAIQVSYVATDYQSVKAAVEGIGKAVTVKVSDTNADTPSNIESQIKSDLESQYDGVTITATGMTGVSDASGSVAYRTATIQVAVGSVTATISDVIVTVIVTA